MRGEKKTPLNAWQFALKIFFAKREEGATHKLNGFLNDNFCHKSVRFRGAQVQVQPCLVGARNVFLLQIWLTGESTGDEEEQEEEFLPHCGETPREPKLCSSPAMPPHFGLPKQVLLASFELLQEVVN